MSRSFKNPVTEVKLPKDISKSQVEAAYSTSTDVKIEGLQNFSINKVDSYFEAENLAPGSLLKCRTPQGSGVMVWVVLKQV